VAMIAHAWAFQAKVRLAVIGLMFRTPIRRMYECGRGPGE
jgi:hypothetical protein